MIITFTAKLIEKIIIEELRRTLLEVSFRVMPFTEFVKAIDQNLLILTEEFVTRVILGSINLFMNVFFVVKKISVHFSSIEELDDQPKSYSMKEQLIFMLPNIKSVRPIVLLVRI